MCYYSKKDYWSHQYCWHTFGYAIDLCQCTAVSNTAMQNKKLSLGSEDYFENEISFKEIKKKKTARQHDSSF